MFKKLVYILVIIIVLILIFLLSPLPSKILKSTLESKVREKFKATVLLEGFKFNLIKGLEIEKISFNRKNFELQSGKTLLVIESLGLFKKYVVLNCRIENVTLGYKKQKFAPLIAIVSGSPNFALFNGLKYDYLKTLLVYDDGDILFNDIEAVGKEAKLDGNIHYLKSKTTYDLNLYLPSKTSENLPDFAKVLLNIEEDENWSKYEIKFTIPKIK